MRPAALLSEASLTELLESLLPDFVLAFAFFTSLIYAVLSRRFDQQRPAVAMSVTLGLALSAGLVWWERANGYSIKDLGPIAIGFALIVLAFVMYQSIRHIGGSWAGAGIALGASILVTQLLQLDVPINPQIIQTLMTTALVVGLFAFQLHRGNSHFTAGFSTGDLNDNKTDMAEIFRDRHLSGRLNKGMKKLRRQSDDLYEHPQQAGDVMVQLKRMLPVEGYLTERLGQLRAKAHRVRNGHIARLDEIRHIAAKLPRSAQKQAAKQLAAGYQQMIGSETRIERLDKAVAENEKRIRDLTRQAQVYAAQYDHRKLYETMKAAQKLQHHNTRLFKTIERTEQRLSEIVKHVAKEVKQYERK